METRANYIAIGLFMIAVISSGFFFMYWLAKSGSGTETRQVVVVFPAPVTGLVKGSQVLFNGIKIGDVTELALVPDHPESVQALVTVNPLAPIKKDTRVEVGYQGLTGVAFVHFIGGTADSASLFDEKLPRVVAKESDFQNLIDGAKAVLKNANSAMTTVKKVIDENGPAITRAIENVEGFSQALANNANGVDTFLADVSAAAKSFSSLSAKIEALSTRADELLAAIDTGSIKGTVEDVRKFAEKLAEASDGVDTVVADARKAVSDISKFASNLNGSMAKVDKIIEGVDSEKIARVVTNVDDITNRFAARGDDIENLIKSARETADYLSSISKGVSGRTEDIQKIISQVRDAAEKLTSTLSSAEKVVAGIDSTKVSRTVTNLDDVAARVASKGPQIESFIDEANSAAASINKFSEAIAARSDEIRAIIDDVKAASGKLDATMVGADKLIAAIDPQKVSRTVKSIDELANRLAGRGEDLEAIVVDTRATMDSAKKVAGDIEARRKDINQVITDTTELAQRLNAAAVRVESIIGRVDSFVGEGSDAAGLLTEATAAARSVRRVSESFESRADTIAGGLARFSNRGLREVENMVAQWRRTAIQLERAIQKIERDPQQFLFGTSGVRDYTPRRR